MTTHWVATCYVMQWLEVDTLLGHHQAAPFLDKWGQLDSWRIILDLLAELNQTAVVKCSFRRTLPCTYLHKTTVSSVLLDRRVTSLDCFWQMSSAAAECVPLKSALRLQPVPCQCFLFDLVHDLICVGLMPHHDMLHMPGKIVYTQSVACSNTCQEDDYQALGGTSKAPAELASCQHMAACLQPAVHAPSPETGPQWRRSN